MEIEKPVHVCLSVSVLSVCLSLVLPHLDHFLDLCNIHRVARVEHVVQEPKHEEALAKCARQHRVRAAEQLARRGIVDVAREVLALPRLYEPRRLEGVHRLAVIQLVIPAGNGCHSVGQGGIKKSHA